MGTTVRNSRWARIRQHCWANIHGHSQLQTARGLGAGTANACLAGGAVRDIERAKWRLWHGRWPGCQRKLAALRRWTKRKHMRDVAGIGRLQRHVAELLGHLERNQDA